MPQDRIFRIKGKQYRARKGLTIGPQVFNAQGYWIHNWYVRPTDKSEEWRPVGATLADLSRWIDSQNAEGQRFEVQEETICDGWVNNWSVDDEPQTFDSYAKAEHDLTEFLADVEDAVERGDMSTEYDRDNYRIVPVE